MTLNKQLEAWTSINSKRHVLRTDQGGMDKDQRKKYVREIEHAIIKYNTDYDSKYDPVNPPYKK